MRCLRGRGRARSGGNFFIGDVGCSIMLFELFDRGIVGSSKGAVGVVPAS